MFDNWNVNDVLAEEIAIIQFQDYCHGTLRKFLDMIAIEISQSTSTVAPKNPSEGKKENQVGTRILQWLSICLIRFEYRTRAIITHGLYIFHPIF